MKRPPMDVPGGSLTAALARAGLNKKQQLQQQQLQLAAAIAKVLAPSCSLQTLWLDFGSLSLKKVLHCRFHCRVGFVNIFRIAAGCQGCLLVCQKAGRAARMIVGENIQATLSRPAGAMIFIDFR